MAHQPDIIWSKETPKSLKYVSLEPYFKGPKDPIIRFLGFGSSYVGYYLGEYMSIRYLDPESLRVNATGTPGAQGDSWC